jgi:hypothetical protein
VGLIMAGEAIKDLISEWKMCKSTKKVKKIKKIKKN